eukprot:scaffold3328_cov184-Alexandrium_tamarense.AAC.4
MPPFANRLELKSNLLPSPPRKDATGRSTLTLAMLDWKGTKDRERISSCFVRVTLYNTLPPTIPVNVSVVFPVSDTAPTAQWASTAQSNDSINKFSNDVQVVRGYTSSINDIVHKMEKYSLFEQDKFIASHR